MIKTKTTSNTGTGAAAATRSSLSSSSSSVSNKKVSSTIPPAPCVPPVFLNLSDTSFSHVTLQQHNFFHVFVGRVQHKLMILPVVLHLHSSLLLPPAASYAGNNHKHSSFILTSFFSRLPQLITEVNLSRLNNIKAKPKLLQTEQILFTYTFKQTQPTYHVMVTHNTTQYRHRQRTRQQDSPQQHDVCLCDGVSVQTCVHPRSLVRRVSHPFIDSEAEDSDAADSDHDSEPSEEKSAEQEQQEQDDRAEQDLLEALDDDEDEEEEDTEDGHDAAAADNPYRGGRYRSFHVSAHSLYVRGIAKEQQGINLEVGEQKQQPENITETNRKRTTDTGQSKSKHSQPKTSPPVQPATVLIPDDLDDEELL